MSCKMTPHGCAISATDIPALKSALEIILGLEFKPTHRLEIFARHAGYRSWAALKSNLEPRLDFSGNKIPLFLQPMAPRQDPFLSGMSSSQQDKLDAIARIGLVPMVEAALAIARDRAPEGIAMTGIDLPQIEIMARSSQASDDFRWSISLPSGQAFLIASPQNVQALKDGIYPLYGCAEAPGAQASDDWHFAPIEIDAEAFSFAGASQDSAKSLKSSDCIDFCQNTSGANLIFWSPEDQMSFTALFERLTDRIVDPRKIITLRDELLLFDEVLEPDFLTVGLFGTTRAPLPIALEAANGPLAVFWLSEMAQVVHGVAYEGRRLEIAEH